MEIHKNPQLLESPKFMLLKIQRIMSKFIKSFYGKYIYFYHKIFRHRVWQKGGGVISQAYFLFRLDDLRTRAQRYLAK